MDIEISKHLCMRLEEIAPIFFTKQVLDEAVPEHMKDYLQLAGRKKGDGKKRPEELSANKLLLYAPLLRLYVEHGAVIIVVYRTIDYLPTKISTCFGEQVPEARRTRDVDQSKALLAEVFKLLGNNGYSKTIEALERHTCVICK